ncbi:MAG: hypothetical protein KJO09_09735 [Gammaproteobacteria bacterium]|nr:hypothetical protein [Gammaproteobacteria bacterium]
MKTMKTALISLLLVMSASAMAQDYAPTRTYEVLVQSVRLPSGPSGTITVKECDDCDYETYRVTAQTVYAVNGKPMRLSDFRKVIDDLRLGSGHVVNVRRDLQTDTIVKVFIYTQ